MILNFWTTAPLLLAAVPQTAFVLIYALRPLGAGQWWRDRVGRALFHKGMALAIVLDLFLAYVLTTGVRAVSFAAPSGWFEVCETVGYWYVCGAVIYQCAALVRARLEERHGRPASL